MFFIDHFSDLCCYEDFLMRIDLMGKPHNDKEILDSLPTCDYHRYIVAEGEVIWIGNDGEKVDNPNITCIPSNIFSFCANIRKIVIPEGVTYIEPNAFYNCIGLESVTIPNSVTSIDYQAFWGCRKLKSVIIPSSVTRIGYYAFVCCDNLKIAKVPKKCNVGELAFSNDTVIRY